MLKAGDRAPDFSLPSTEGKNISLSDLRGKKVVLYFYPKDDTPGCTKESCSFSDNLAKVRSKGAVIYGVSADSIKSHHKFIDKYKLTFPLLSDETKEMINAYGIWGEKSFMGKKYMGIIRTTFILDEKSNITHIFSPVKVDGHTEEVLAAL